MRSEPNLNAGSVVARYFDMWNTGDTTGAADLIHPDWLDHNHPEVQGAEGVAQAIERVRTARPSLRFHLEQILPSDDGCVVVVGHVMQSATVSDEPPMIWRIRLSDGRMTEMWTYRAHRVGVR